MQRLLGIQAALCIVLALAVPGYAEGTLDEMHAAAERGDARSQYLLGTRYYSGRDVEQDNIQAHFWVNLAAKQGDRLATLYRDHLKTFMTPEQIAQAEKMARNWHPKKP